MQRRAFFIVLAFATSAFPQVQSPPRPPAPVVEIDTDVDPAPPINASSGLRFQQRRSLGNSLVSVADLSTPQRARKELEKANQSFTRQNWAQARDRLDKAISFYPAYAGAYNNLAVAYAYLGDAAQERQALEKAVALNDHFALAHVNLGRIDLKEGKLAEAEVTLAKAATLEPGNAEVLVLLSYCQLLQKRFNDAIATSKAAHLLSFPHAPAHRFAARAFEQKGQFDEALAELNVFLRESPEGTSADEARQEIQAVRAAQRK